jgi:hypothetical protein
MQKLRLALVLPIIQFVVAAILLQSGDPHVPMYVPTARLICWGLSAPALLFRALNPIGWGPTFERLPRSIVGVDTDDLFFLAGVIVVWYIAGRALDQRRTSKTAGRSGILTTSIVYPLLLVLGGVLLFGGLYDLEHPSSNNPDHPVRGLLTLMWSVSLIFLSGRGLVRAIRHAFRGSV